VHVVLDNLSAHKSEPVKKWLAHPKRRRWHLHFTATSASWVNLIENWFSLLTRKRLTNSAFTSVTDLVDAINEWTSHWNDDPHPFVWTKPAADIITKVQRGRATLTHQINSATHH
jgi:transposase